MLSRQAAAQGCREADPPPRQAPAPPRCRCPAPPAARGRARGASASWAHPHRRHRGARSARLRVCALESTKALRKPWSSSPGNEDTVLVADIGGTNCRFELWRVDLDDASKHEKVLQKIYRTADYATFPDALHALTEEPLFRQHTPRAAAFAVAGPVAANKCEMTNLSWTVDGDYLSRIYGVRIAVLNDFEAVGYGVPALDEDDMVTLNDVPEAPKGPKVVLGPGTGLGQAQLLWDALLGAYRVWPSEGSHATFAPRGWKQRALQAYVEKELGSCEIEHVACGSGLERVYAFLQTDEACNRPELDLRTRRDAPAITKAALEGGDPLAAEAVDMFLAILGAEAGYMGLRALATGGVYVCGGITPRLIERISDRRCLVDSFLHTKSRFNKVLRTFPLYAVTNDGLGLLGTREYACQLLRLSRTQLESLVEQPKGSPAVPSPL